MPFGQVSRRAAFSADELSVMKASGSWALQDDAFNLQFIYWNILLLKVAKMWHVSDNLFFSPLFTTLELVSFFHFFFHMHMIVLFFM